MLNYGYAVLRAATARAICAAGLTPAIGIHHHNRYDAHRLADDLMEPFRPWVDRRVRWLLRDDRPEVTRDTKPVLLEVLTDPVVMPTGRGPLLVALERLASSLADCFLEASKLDGRSSSIQIAEGLAVPRDGPGELDDPI